MSVELEGEVYSDQYTVQWFKWLEADKYYAVSEDIKDQFKFNPATIEESVFEENDDAQGVWGKYYAVVTNHVNGSSASTQSNEYIVY